MKKNSLGFSPAAQGQGERGKSAKDCNAEPQARQAATHWGERKNFWLSKDLELACLTG